MVSRRVGSGPEEGGFGNNWVIAGIVVTLPFLMTRTVCLPMAVRLVVKNTTSAPRL